MEEIVNEGVSLYQSNTLESVYQNCVVVDGEIL